MRLKEIEWMHFNLGKIQSLEIESYNSGLIKSLRRINSHLFKPDFVLKSGKRSIEPPSEIEWINSNRAQKTFKRQDFNHQQLEVAIIN